MSEETSADDPRRRQAAFLRKLAHEMRTPLGSMLMLAELLADNAAGRLGEREIGYARKIQRAGAEVSGVLEAVLDLSRIETGAVEVDRRDVGVAEVVEEARRLAGDRALELEVDVSDELPATLATDRVQLKRLLGHLIDHAAGAAAGPIALRLAPAGDGAVEIALSHDGATIPDERRPAAFEPFQPGQRGKAALALPIARALAELLGGRLELRRGEDGADRFVLRLPLST